MGIDYFRGVGPVEQLAPLLELLQTIYGSYVPRRNGGQYNYDFGYQFDYAVGVYWSEEGANKGVCVQMSGESLAYLGDTINVHHVIHEILSRGFRCTRLDIAVDFKSEQGGFDLIDRVHQSCLNDELCGAKKYLLHEEHCGQKLSGKTISIGSRGGNGSGKYVRVYDKGLEQKTDEANHWIRWELELTKDYAANLACDIFITDYDEKRLVEIAFSAIDFRESNGSTAKARRPRCGWYQRFLNGIQPVPLIYTRPESSLERYQKWLEQSVFPPLKAMSQTSEQPAEKVLHVLGYDEITPHPDYQQRPIIHQFKQQIDELTGGVPQN